LNYFAIIFWPTFILGSLIAYGFRGNTRKRNAHWMALISFCLLSFFLAIIFLRIQWGEWLFKEGAFWEYWDSILFSPFFSN
jgi:Na+-driven multidrug efflux pump